MQKLFNFLMVGLTFTVLNAATVAAQGDTNPLESNNTPPEQVNSELVDALDGGANLSAGDRAGVDAAADKVTLEASAAEEAQIESAKACILKTYQSWASRGKTIGAAFEEIVSCDTKCQIKADPCMEIAGACLSDAEQFFNEIWMKVCGESGSEPFTIK